MSTIRVERLQAPSGGANTEASPDYVPDNQAPVLTNLIPRPGKVVMRGGFDEPFANTTKSEVCNRPWHFADTDKTLLFFDSDTTTVRRIDENGTMTTFNAGSISACPAGDNVEVDAYVYGISADGHFLRWDGTAAITSYTNPAYSASAYHVAVRTHLRRLFVLRSDSALIWSDQITSAALPDTAAAWQDDASGLDNKLLIEAGDPRGLAVIRAGLVIFFSDSVWLLRGKTPSTFTLERISAEYGCRSQSSICEWGDGVFFHSRQGLMWFDGSALEVVSGPVNSELNPRFDPVVLDPFEDSWLLLTVLPIFGGMTLTSNSAITAYLFNPETGSWVGITSDAFLAGKPVMAIPRGDGQHRVFDGTRLWDVDGVTRPESQSASIRGKDHNGSTTVAIEAEWRSRLAHLGSPSNKAQLRRVLLDYTFQIDGAVSEGVGWYVTLYDGTGTQLLAETQLAGQTDPPTQLYRRRAQLGCYSEAIDVQMRVSWRYVGTPPAIEKAELHDAFVEYQVTRPVPTS